MNWDKLKAFHIVAKCGSFAQAASQIHLTPSAVSRQIADLEESLGVSLFNRHSRGLAITESGKILYQTTEEILHKLAETEALLNQKEAQNSLRIATNYDLSTSWLPQYLKEFLSIHPETNLTITSDDNALGLQNNQIAIRTEVPHQPDLSHIHLTTLHFGLYASLEYLEKFGAPKTAVDLDQHRLLTLDENASWPLHLGLKSNQSPRTPYLRINSAYGLMKCVEEGIGIAALSKEFASKNLIPVLPDQTGPIVKIYYVYQASLKNLKHVTALGEFLQQKLQK